MTEELEQNQVTEADFEQQEIVHDHIRQARGEISSKQLDDLEDNFEPPGYKELMKI